MAGITQQDQTAGIANQIISLTSQLYGIGQAINLLSSQWTNLSVANKLNAFPTSPLTPTGGITSPGDAEPVVTDPIDITQNPGSLLSRAMSANDLAGLLTFLQGVASVIGGGAVSANGAAAQLIAKTL